MVMLRERMQERYANWQADLSEEQMGADGQVMPGWRTFFAECPAPNWAAIPEALVIEDDAQAWPGRRNERLPQAPADAHICRAFDRIEPDGVRVVVLGQDPYPSISSATGRAFEDGAWGGQRTEEIAGSLKFLLLAALATRGGHAGLFQTGSWQEVRRQIQDGEFVLPAVRDYFDTLAGQGVLFVNAAWTRTGNEHLAAHRSLWKPILDHMLRALAQADQTVIFLLLGDDARKTFCAADPVCCRSGIVDSAHPRSPKFLQDSNPLERVNLRLRELRAPDQVTWWHLQ